MTDCLLTKVFKKKLLARGLDSIKAKSFVVEVSHARNGIATMQLQVRDENNEILSYMPVVDVYEGNTLTIKDLPNMLNFKVID